jgi:hypothetical protein
MARQKFSLNFDGFLEYANKVDQLGKGYLKTATENALTKSKDYINSAISQAMDASPYHFNREPGSRSKGTAKKSLKETASLPVEWEGSVAYAYIGADLKVAPEEIILAMGSPHIRADVNLRKAIKAKGKYGKESARIQQEEFAKVIEEGLQK